MHRLPIGKPGDAGDEGIPLGIWDRREVFGRFEGEAAGLEHCLERAEVGMRGHERWPALRRYLEKNAVASAVHYPLPHHLQPAYADLGLKKVFRRQKPRPKKSSRFPFTPSSARTTPAASPRKLETSSRHKRLMRIALFSPLPPSPTGVADYSRLLLQGLSEAFPVEAYTGEPIDPPLDVSCYSWQEFEKRQSVEPKALPLYQMGNSLHHDFMCPLVFHHPGMLVLHDLVLHHYRLAMYMNSPEVADYKAHMGDTGKRDRLIAKLSEYTAEVEALYPNRGGEIAEIAIRMGGGRLLYQYPLHELLVRASK